jgi:hypothetical protein
MADEEPRYKRLPPKMQGVKVMKGRRYIWLLDHRGIPQKHWLDQYKATKDGKK